MFKLTNSSVTKGDLSASLTLLKLCRHTEFETNTETNTKDMQHRMKFCETSQKVFNLEA